jgi:hypothetical protein
MLAQWQSFTFFQNSSKCSKARFGKLQALGSKGEKRRRNGSPQLDF